MSNENKSSGASSGIGIGVVLAVILSWTTHHSILWAILHSMCSWLYVIYWAIYYS
jgi:hypothetical protein